MGTYVEGIYSRASAYSWNGKRRQSCKNIDREERKADECPTLHLPTVLTVSPTSCNSHGHGRSLGKEEFQCEACMLLLWQGQLLDVFSRN